VRVEGRVNGHEIHHGLMRDGLAEINRELHYIRTRVDDLSSRPPCRLS
jgi:hypothetical protein